MDGPSISQAAKFTMHGKTPPPPVGDIYVLNLGANDGQGATVTEYDGTSKGNAPPIRTLQLDSKLYARSIVVDASAISTSVTSTLNLGSRYRPTLPTPGTKSRSIRPTRAAISRRLRS